MVLGTLWEENMALLTGNQKTQYLEKLPKCVTDNNTANVSND